MSLTHSSAISYLGWSGHCLVQTSKPDIDAHEFMAMIADGLNFVLLYAPWLSKLINVAREDVNVLKALQGMKQVSYTGAALNPEDEQWLIEKGIQATVCSILYIYHSMSINNKPRSYMQLQKLVNKYPTHLQQPS